MPKPLTILILFLTEATIAFAQPSILQQKCFGGSNNEGNFRAHETSDGGSFIVGATLSNDGEVSGLHDTLQDVWVVKLDANANLQWQKCLGGTNADLGYDGYEAGNGYFVVAYSKSNDGNVSGNHGDHDYWVVRLNKSRQIIWQKSIGGSSNDNVQFATLSLDKAIVITGFTDSNDGDFTGNKGQFDLWVTKVDTFGNIVWNKNYGGSDADIGVGISTCSDGGYIVAGASSSIDGDPIGCDQTSGSTWVLRLDADGDLIWQKCLGGSLSEEGFNAMQVFEGGYMVLSFTESNDGDVSGNHGIWDYWLVHLDSDGDIIWQKCFGGSNLDIPFGLLETSDHHFILSGWVDSNDGDVSGNHGSADGWIIEVDSSGNLVWQKCIGGSGYDEMWDVSFFNGQQVIFTGGTNSTDGDVTNNHGGNDIVLIKLSSVVGIPSLITYPAFIIGAFPLPASDEINVTINSKNSDKMTLELFNSIGQAVLSMGNIAVNPGNQIVSIRSNNLPSGSYHLVARSELQFGETEVAIIR